MNFLASFALPAACLLAGRILAFNEANLHAALAYHTSETLSAVFPCPSPRPSG
jgi:hypothetical protein